jgi:hypothetical protein
MAYGIVSNSSRLTQTSARPSITSYDDGYEHSLDHYVDVKLLLLDDDRDNEANQVPATFAFAS